MNASHYAGTVIVPTLSRIVLCAAFFTAGWAKVFTNATYSPEEAAVLQKLDVDVRQSVSSRHANQDFALASMPMTLLEQDEPSEPGQDEPSQAEPAQDEPVQDEPVQDEPTQDEPADPELPAEDDEADDIAAPPPAPPDSPTAEPITGPAEAQTLYKVAITLDNAGWQYAYWLAWATAIVELVGGALLLIGLFSRLWGLGLAVTMAMAFHIMSLDAFLDAPFEIARKTDGGAWFNQIYAQLALFVLAFGIFITGPGPLSLDRAIFRRHTHDEVDIDIHESP